MDIPDQALRKHFQCMTYGQHYYCDSCGSVFSPGHLRPWDELTEQQKIEHINLFGGFRVGICPDCQKLEEKCPTQ